MVDWWDLVSDLKVDIVCIIMLNKVYRDMVIVVLEVGKYVYFEKLMVFMFEDVKEMCVLVDKIGVRMIVGYNYLYNLVFVYICKLIVDGVIGWIVYFCGMVDEDY